MHLFRRENLNSEKLSNLVQSHSQEVAELIFKSAWSDFKAQTYPFSSLGSASKFRQSTPREAGAILGLGDQQSWRARSS